MPLLPIAVSYYLRASLGGHALVLTDSSDYRDLTDRNLQAMRKEHGSDRFPLSFTARSAKNCSEFDLVIVENNPYHLQIPNCTASVVLIRREGASNSVVDTYFPSHTANEIVKGRSTADIRAEGKRTGYAIIPYVLAEKSENNYILLESPTTAKNTQMCPEKEEAVKGKEELRSLLEYVRNRTADCSLYFDVPQNELIPLLFKAGMQKVYTGEGMMTPTSTLIAVSAPSQMPRSKRNVYVTRQSRLGSFDFSLGAQDAVLIWAEAGSVLAEDALKKWTVSTLSPRNNDGCFLPPASLDGVTAGDKSRFLVLQPRAK